jgi:hypothetical protein
MAKNGCNQLAVEALHHSFGGRVVCWGPDVSRPCQDIQVPEEERLELPPLVCGDTLRHTESANPRLEKGAGNSLCLMVGYGHRFRPP